MGLGTGAINLSKLPQGVGYEVNPAAFNQATTKQDQPVEVFPLPSPTSFKEISLLKSGIVARLRLLVKGAFTTSGTVSMTPSVMWPNGIFSNVQLSGNSLNNFISCSSFDLKLIERMNNRALNDTYTKNGVDPGTVISTDETVPFQCYVDVPIAIDMTTLVGALYAQSDVTNLTLNVTTNSIANLFTITTGSVALVDAAGNPPSITVEEVMFTVPYAPGSSSKILIPDLTVLHGIVSNNTAVAGSQQVTQKLLRITGQLERLAFYETAGNDLPGASSFANALLLYNAADNPMNFNPIDLLEIENNQNYRDALPDGVLVIDNMAQNAPRDQMYIQNLAELRLTVNHASTYVPGSAEQLHVVEELLYA